MGPSLRSGCSYSEGLGLLRAFCFGPQPQVKLLLWRGGTPQIKGASQKLSPRMFRGNLGGEIGWNMTPGTPHAAIAVACRCCLEANISLALVPSLTNLSGVRLGMCCFQGCRRRSDIILGSFRACAVRFACTYHSPSLREPEGAVYSTLRVGGPMP